MPYDVKFNPQTASLQSQRITDATINADGVMTKELVRLLLSLVPAAGASVSFLYVVQSSDGSDFMVPIPIAKRPINGNYVVSITLMSVDQGFAAPKIPFADQAADEFRVVLDGAYDAGTILGFILRIL